MNLLQSLRSWFRGQMFIPSRYAILFNSNYIVSRGTSGAIKKYSEYMRGRMLDFGCGIKPYRSLFSVDQHIGVDIENPGHSNDLSYVDKFYGGNVIPFGDEYFDSLFSSEVLTHIFTVDEVIVELKRVLKKDGYFLLTVPFAWKENEMPNDSVRYTSSGIRFLLEQNGFEIVAQEKRGNYFLAVIQLFSDYLYSSLPRIKALRFFFTLVVIFPINASGIFLSYIFPRNTDFFINNVIVARKK